MERQNNLSKGRHGFTGRETFQWKNTHMGSPAENKSIWTPCPEQGLTGDPGKLTPILGLALDCSAQSDCWGCWRILHQGSPSGELYCRRKQVLTSLGEGEWRSKCDTGQLFPPLACYPTHGKKLAQRGDCKLSRRCSVSQPTALQLSARET